jgi:hypothetical protein
MNSITFVLFDKYCLFVDQLGLKDSSRVFQLNCVISYFFTYIYYFMHGSKDWCDGESEKILTFRVHLNKTLFCNYQCIVMYAMSLQEAKFSVWNSDWVLNWTKLWNSAMTGSYYILLIDFIWSSQQATDFDFSLKSENAMICAVPDCSLAIWEAVDVTFGCHRRQELESVTLETQNWMCMRPCCTLPPEIFAVLLKIPVHTARS